MDVEGAYLEGWCWYLRGEALEAAQGDAEAAPPRPAAEEGEAEEALSKEECWIEALGSLLECKTVRCGQHHPALLIC